MTETKLMIKRSEKEMKAIKAENTFMFFLGIFAVCGIVGLRFVIQSLAHHLFGTDLSAMQSLFVVSGECLIFFVVLGIVFLISSMMYNSASNEYREATEEEKIKKYGKNSGNKK